MGLNSKWHQLMCMVIGDGNLIFAKAIQRCVCVERARFFS